MKIGDLKDTPNKVLGDAYRAALHEKNKHLFGNPFQNGKDFLLFCAKNGNDVKVEKINLL